MNRVAKSLSTIIFANSMEFHYDVPTLTLYGFISFDQLDLLSKVVGYTYLADNEVTLVWKSGNVAVNFTHIFDHFELWSDLKLIELVTRLVDEDQKEAWGNFIKTK